MITHGSAIKIFSGNSNIPLAQEIASCLGTELGNCNVSRFSDGEVSVSVGETVRGADVFVIQSTSHPVNDHLMELLIMIDAFKRASAARITAVIPYYGYARQDRKVRARDSIAAKLVADILTRAGAHRVLTMDLHAVQIQGFFDIPLDHLLCVPLLAQHYLHRKFDGDDLVVVSPDLGGVTRARAFAKRLNAPLAIIDKRRPKPNMAEVMNIVGEVEGKRCIFIDDMVDTAGSLIKGAEAIKKSGAKSVYACATHGVLSGEARQRIADSCLEEVVISNTIAQPEDGVTRKIRTFSVADTFAKAIRYIYEDLPFSVLYD